MFWGTGDPDAAIWNIKAVLTDAPGGYKTEYDKPNYQYVIAEGMLSPNVLIVSDALMETSHPRASLPISPYSAPASLHSGPIPRAQAPDSVHIVEPDDASPERRT
jgi:hypothetical protein